MIPSPVVSRGFGPNPRLMSLGHSPIITILEAAREVVGGARLKTKQAFENIQDLFFHVRAGLQHVNHVYMADIPTGEDKKVYSSSEPAITVYASLDNTGNKTVKEDLSRIFINATLKAITKK